MANVSEYLEDCYQILYACTNSNRERRLRITVGPLHLHQRGQRYQRLHDPEGRQGQGQVREGQGRSGGLSTASVAPPRRHST